MAIPFGLIASGLGSTAQYLLGASQKMYDPVEEVRRRRAKLESGLNTQAEIATRGAARQAGRLAGQQQRQMQLSQRASGTEGTQAGIEQQLRQSSGIRESLSDAISNIEGLKAQQRGELARKFDQAEIDAHNQKLALDAQAKANKNQFIGRLLGAGISAVGGALSKAQATKKQAMSNFNFLKKTGQLPKDADFEGFFNTVKEDFGGNVPLASKAEQLNFQSKGEQKLLSQAFPGAIRQIGVPFSTQLSLLSDTVKNQQNQMKSEQQKTDTQIRRSIGSLNLNEDDLGKAKELLNIATNKETIGALNSFIGKAKNRIEDTNINSAILNDSLSIIPQDVRSKIEGQIDSNKIYDNRYVTNLLKKSSILTKNKEDKILINKLNEVANSNDINKLNEIASNTNNPSISRAANSKLEMLSSREFTKQAEISRKAGTIDNKIIGLTKTMDFRAKEISDLLNKDIQEVRSNLEQNIKDQNQESITHNNELLNNLETIINNTKQGKRINLEFITQYIEDSKQVFGGSLFKTKKLKENLTQLREKIKKYNDSVLNLDIHNEISGANKTLQNQPAYQTPSSDPLGLGL